MVAAQASVASARAQKEVALAQLHSAESQVTQNAAVLQAAQLDLNHTQIVAHVIRRATLSAKLTRDNACRRTLRAAP